MHDNFPASFPGNLVLRNSLLPYSLNEERKEACEPAWFTGFCLSLYLGKCFCGKCLFLLVAKYLKDLAQLSLGDFTTLMNWWPERTSLLCTSIFYFTLVVSSRCNPIISRIRRLNDAHSPSFCPVCCPRVNVYSDTCTSTTSEAGRTHFKASRHAVTKWRKRNEIYIGTVCYQGSSSSCALIVVSRQF